MNLADLILYIFWSIFAFTVVTMVALIAQRCWANWRDRTRQRQRAQVIDLLKAWSDQPDGPVPTLADDVSTDLAVDILHLLRGDEKNRMAGRAVQAGVAATLHARLRRGDRRTRILAAAALENFVEDESREALLRALDDSDIDVRLAAALALATNGQAPPPKETMARLRLRGGEASALVGTILFRIALTDPECVRAFLVDPETEPATKAACAEALARVDDFPAIGIIVALAMNSAPWDAELPRYLAALAVTGHPDGTPAVLHCLESPSPVVKAAAAQAAGGILAVAALDRLEGLLGDGDFWVRLHAAQALLIYGPRGEWRLRRAARSAPEPARETAALILAERRNAA